MEKNMAPGSKLSAITDTCLYRPENLYNFLFSFFFFQRRHLG